VKVLFSLQEMVPTLTKYAAPASHGRDTGRFDRSRARRLQWVVENRVKPERAGTDHGAPAETSPLRLASEAWPPFTNVAEQSRLAIDLVHEAFRLESSA
jgi:hypothetical protein